jgi:transposase InsO family protein
VIVAYVDVFKYQFGVEPMCRVLRGHSIPIAPSTYYACKTRPPSARECRDAALLPRLKRAFEVNYSCYGARKVWRQLRSEGHQVGRDQVARLMRIAGIHGARRQKRVFTTVPAPVQRELPDLVKRRWDRGEPDRVWVADLTYVPSSEGTVYTCFIQDGGSKRILGFTVASSMGASIVTRALEQAVATRRRSKIGFTADGLIHHSDRGSQYVSLALSTRLQEHGIAPSVGRTGTALDNAAMENTIGLYKTELIRTRRWASRQEVETATSAWVTWFNERRLHSTLDYQSPNDYENRYHQQQALPRQAA